MSWNDCAIAYFFFEHELNPKGVYKGQNPITLVKMKIMANAINTIPNVPLIFSLKKSNTIIVANTKRMIRSTVPIFDCILNYLSVNF